MLQYRTDCSILVEFRDAAHNRKQARRSSDARPEAKTPL